MKTLLFIFLSSVILSVPVCAGAEQNQAAQTESKTVWVDAHFGFRKKSGAKGINKIHKQMEAEGWSFVDMELYDENGDLEGFFITYSRPIKSTPVRYSEFQSSKN